MTVGGRSDAGCVDEPLPHVNGTVVTALCACGEVASIDMSRPVLEAAVCSCGLRAGDGIMTGPHAQTLVRQQMPRRQAEQRADTEATNVVYFARVGNIVKIGTTGNLPQRMASLGWPALLGVLDGGYQLETAMHHRFVHLHVTGELFRAEPELLEFAAREGYMPLLERPLATVDLDSLDVG